MFIKDLKECPEIRAGDGSALRELLHPDKGPFPFGYSLAHALVKPHEQTQPHRLKSSEVYCIIEGRGLIHVGKETAEVTALQVVYIPPFHVQFIENIGESDLAFLCIVDPAWQPDDEEVLPDGTDGRDPRAVKKP
jgi:mannose-6-phosphate isomerase-like protein (cupin superfamily)